MRGRDFGVALPASVKGERPVAFAPQPNLRQLDFERDALTVLRELGAFTFPVLVKVPESVPEPLRFLCVSASLRGKMSPAQTLAGGEGLS